MELSFIWKEGWDKSINLKCTSVAQRIYTTISEQPMYACFCLTFFNQHVFTKGNALISMILLKWNTLERFLKLFKTLTVHVLTLVKNFCALCSILTNDKTILFFFWTLLKLIPVTKNSVSLVSQDNLKVHLLQLWLTSLLNELLLNIWICTLAHIFYHTYNNN